MCVRLRGKLKKPSLDLSVNVDSVQNIAILALSLEYLKPEDGYLTETYLQRLVKYVPWTQLFIINSVSLESGNSLEKEEEKCRRQRDRGFQDNSNHKHQLTGAHRCSRWQSRTYMDLC